MSKILRLSILINQSRVFMKNLFSFRLLYLYAFIIVLVLLGLSLYLEIYQGLLPCPLCVLQRITLGFLGVIFFFAATLSLKKIGEISINILALLTAFLGVVLSGRQVWLQHLPLSDHTECGVSLRYMLEVLPLNEVLQKV